MKFLVINPGSTSTKIAVFEDTTNTFTLNIKHTTDEINCFPRIINQYQFRKEFIIYALQKEEIDVNSFDAIVGRGGLVKPIPGGVYRVNETMISDLRKEIMGEHPSNLGGLLALEIAKEIGKPEMAFIVDPVVVDELCSLARLSGLPELPRLSIFHALNQKAVARRYAKDVGKKYEELNLIVCHLGGGITVGAHEKGKVIDVNNGLDGEGPYSPERSGTLPAGALVKLCYSGKYTFIEVKKMLTGKGGLVAHLGTNSAIDVESKINAGDEKANLLYEGIAYNIAKYIGAFATTMKGKVDGILITGGIAYSKILCDWIEQRVNFIAPVKIFPGEDEMIALAEGVHYALNGEIPILEYK